MNSMNLIVARNIKRLREEKKLSMDELAKLSGVSKSMLAQVERGEGNPTLSTLWKLSNGMKVPFNALTVSPQRPPMRWCTQRRCSPSWRTAAR